MHRQLIEFSYVSKATSGLSRTDLIRILETAQAFNQTHNITGILFFEDGFFAQLLEGHKQDVLLLWERIQKDPRHLIIQELDIKFINRRSFPGWYMQFIESEKIIATVPKISIAIHALPGSQHKLLTLMRSISRKRNTFT